MRQARIFFGRELGFAAVCNDLLVPALGARSDCCFSERLHWSRMAAAGEHKVSGDGNKMVAPPSPEHLDHDYVSSLLVFLPKTKN